VNLLVLHAGAVGDFLLSLPALTCLGRKFPGAGITLACNPVLRELVREFLRFECVSIDDARLAGLFVDDGDPGGPRELLGRNDLAVLWLEDASGVVAANLRRLGVGTVLGGRGKPDPEGPEHACDFFMAALSSIECSTRTLEPHLVAPETWRRVAAKYLGSLGIDTHRAAPVVAHPGSGSLAKNWPARHFARLLATVTDELARPVLLLKGPADDGAFRELAGCMDIAGIPVLDNQPLTLVAAALAQSRLFVGNDSGMAHLAACLGVPALVIFGPTRPDIWAPRGRHVRVATGARPGEFPDFDLVRMSLGSLMREA